MSIVMYGRYAGLSGSLGLGTLRSVPPPLVWILLLLMVGSWTPASGESAPSARADQAHGVDAPSQPSGWSSAETWAWSEITDGRVADFDAKLGTTKASGKNTHERFGDPRRVLGAGFLRSVLTEDQFRGAVPPEGVRIRGAAFENDVDIRDAVLTRVLEISDSRFAKKVQLNRLRTSTSVSFDGSTFEDEVWLDSVRIGGNLVMTNSNFGRVMLKTARIDGDFSLSRSSVNGELNLNGSVVGGSIFLKSCSFAGVDLTAAMVGRQLITSGSLFDGTFEAGGLSTGNHLLMNDQAKFADLILRGARIGGQLSLSTSTFGGRFDGESMIVDQDFHMVKASFDGVTHLPLIRVGGSLDVGGANLTILNLSGATVGKDLAFGARGNPVRWGDSVDADQRARGPWLSLWNASVGGLVDDSDSWPDNLQIVMRDFTYERLTSLDNYGTEIGQLRDADWYVDWLDRDPSGSFQPYRQLARVLTSYGNDRVARTVLVAGRERHRKQMPWWSPNRWGLLLLHWSIRYGYGSGELRALPWGLLWILIGSTIAWRKGMGWCDALWYSIDMFLPGIQFSARHRELPGLERYYFRVHRLVGYALLLLVVAGLTGLTDPPAP